MPCVVVKGAFSHPEVDGLGDEDVPVMFSVWSTILTVGFVPRVGLIAEDNSGTPTPSGSVCTWLIGPAKNSIWLRFIFLLPTSPSRLDVSSKTVLEILLRRDKSEEMHLFARGDKGKISQRTGGRIL